MTKSSKRGIDSLLTVQAKAVEIGGKVRLTLVKGPSSNLEPQPDPIQKKAPAQAFPLICKFPESVVQPDFSKAPWNDARLYQQDIPKQQDDSDDDEAAATASSGTVKRRWNSRRKEAPKRQWVLQPQVEFLQTMMAKRQKKALPKDTISERYHGVPEFNASQYILLEQSSSNNNAEQEQLIVTNLPSTTSTVVFSQPAARKTLSLSEAEQALEDQRSNISRYMMHSKQQKGPAAMMASNKPGMSKSKQRLFGKLQQKAAATSAAGEEDDDDDDDVMGDLSYRNRKGGSSKARKELLSSLGDNLAVDPNGVLAGANDSEFGRGMKFGRFQANHNNSNSNDKKNSAAESTKGNDGLAMADDFYQRDVQAEYEELDYDVNEQFDDDDVDVGETEMVVDGSGGYADGDDDDDALDDLEGDENPTGAEGLASLAGFKLLLAKARGEITPEQAAEAAAAQGDKNKQRELAAAARAKAKGNEGDDQLAQIMAGAEAARDKKVKDTGSPSSATSNQGSSRPTSPAAAAAAAPKEELTGVEVDENGLRMVSLQAVRREIWLHHGTIPMKRLMKIFDIKKKSDKERQDRFREAIKELCTMETDPINGRMLVLKQHYQNMG